MERNPNNVHQEFIRLVPSSLVKNISCFVLYDNHPRDERRVDITVCTDNGVLKEYFQRNQLSSLDLKTASEPKEIRIFRNRDAVLFYLIGTKNQLIIVSSTENLQIFMKIDNVEHFSVVDSSRHGQRCLQVTKKDDAVPLMFDDNLKCIGELFSEVSKADSLPIVNELKRKLIEARYTVQNNERSYEEYVKLRHLATLAGQQTLHPNNGVCFQKDSKSKTGSLTIKTPKPWVKVCNKKMVIAVTVLNEYQQPIQDIHMLINSSLTSLSYTTKIFKSNEINNYPHWQESQTRTVESNCEAIVVAVVNVEDLKQSTISGINFNMLISFKMEAEHLMPLEDVTLSSMDTLGDQFEALSKPDDDSQLTIVAIISTTEKTDLRLRRISTDEPQQSLMDLFINYLHMDRISPMCCAFVKSPYHALNGVMVSLKCAESPKISDGSFYTRTKFQLLALLHFINDAIPERIIITPPYFVVTAKTPNLREFTEKIPDIPKKDHTMYSSTILNRTGAILEYLDNCMFKMNESKDTTVLNRIGSQIDLFALGKTSFMEFRCKLLDEAKKGSKCVMELDTEFRDTDNECDEPMLVD